jgi:PIN domain nuclease of toxin-antitoxin system
LGSDDFQVDPRVFRRNLVDNGYVELPITTGDALAVLSLPPIHKDPFDRMLIAQAMVEGVTLLTVDRPMTLYPGAIPRV